MENKSLILLMGLFVLTGVTACSKKSPTTAEAPKALYHCAMHPQIISDKPGECPICHMRLIPIEQHGTPNTQPRKLLYYRNPMTPSATSPVPMKDSMGMDYIP